jgi:hypothetical protein
MLDLMLIILTSAITALTTTTILTLYKPAIERMELLWEKLVWKHLIPEGFKGKGKLLKIAKKGTNIKLFDEIYTNVGMLEYNFGGVKYFLIQIKPQKNIKTRRGIRWIGFEDERIYFWAETIDEEFWETILKKPKLNISETISIEYIKENIKKDLEPSIKLGNQRAKIYEAQHGKVLILSGEYAVWQAECNRFKLLINESFNICCIYYGGELCDSETYVGRKIQESEIKLVKLIPCVSLSFN